jgi:hypothetical protein
LRRQDHCPGGFDKKLELAKEFSADVTINIKEYARTRIWGSYPR